MALALDVPGRRSLRLEHVVLDVNGTLTDRGRLIDEAGELLRRVGETLEVHLLSADTFGTLETVAARLGASARRISSGDEKRRVVEELGADRCAAVGNGANDEAMLAAAALGIAVVGPEGAAGVAVRAADVVCTSILTALALLLDEQALRATLRT
jgi:P-type E1-E2 ATPase